VHRSLTLALAAALLLSPSASIQRSAGPEDHPRIALLQQPFSPTGVSAGPRTMANGGIQQILTGLGATVRVAEARLTAEEDTEYGAWKRLGMALGHFADLVATSERDGYFPVGLLATCPSMPGMVAGLQHSGPTSEPIRPSPPILSASDSDHCWTLSVRAPGTRLPNNVSQTST